VSQMLVCVRCVCGVCVCVRQMCVRVRCVCGVCVRCVCVCVCVWLLLFCFRLAGMGVVVLLSCFESCCVLFRCVLAFELTGCCAFFVLGCFVACPFVSAFSQCCRRWSWFVMDVLCLFWSASCCLGCSRLDWPCVLCFFIFTPLLMQGGLHAV